MARNAKRFRRTGYVLEQVINPEVRAKQIQSWKNKGCDNVDYKEERKTVYAKTMKNALRKARKMGDGVEIQRRGKGVWDYSWFWYYDGWFWS